LIGFHRESAIQAVGAFFVACNAPAEIFGLPGPNEKGRHPFEVAAFYQEGQLAMRGTRNRLCMTS
jgi:hypothetical protein